MAITSALADRLGPTGSVTPTAASNRGTNSREAYDLYLKGQYYLTRRRAGLEGAVTSFEAAIARDPQFGRAYAGLANALALLTYFGDKQLDQQRVIGAAERALSIDSTLAEAHVGLGILYLSIGQFAVSERELRRAIAMEPQNAAAHFQLGRCLMHVGRLDEATESYERAKSLEPFQPAIATWLGFVLTYNATPGLGRNEADRAWQLDSSSGVVQIAAAMTALDDDRPNDALRVVRNSSVRSVMNQGSFAFVLGKAGYPDSTRATIAEIEARGAARWNDNVALMIASLAISDTTRALNAMERGWARGESVTGWWPLWAKMFDPIRQSPRFIELSRRVGVDITARSPRRGT